MQLQHSDTHSVLQLLGGAAVQYLGAQLFHRRICSVKERHISPERHFKDRWIATKSISHRKAEFDSGLDGGEHKN